MNQENQRVEIGFLNCALYFLINEGKRRFYAFENIGVVFHVHPEQLLLESFPLERFFIDHGYKLL